MFHLARFHALAASRRDGLRPEFLDLLRERSERVRHGVTEIHGGRQAGPDPTPRIDGPLPENVVRIGLAAPGNPAKMIRKCK